MTATNHVLTGAVIAVAVVRPELAIPLAFVSHFVIDAIPHFGFAEEDWLDWRASRPVRLVMAADAMCTVLSGTLLPFVVHHYQPGMQPWVVFACMLAAYLPDLFWLYKLIRGVPHSEWHTSGRLARFHKKIQWSETMRGLHVEYVWAAGMALLLGVMI